MIKRLLILLCFVTLSSRISSPNVTDENEKLRTIVKEKKQAEVVISMPDRAELELLTRNVSIASVNGKQVHIILSPLTVEWFIFRNYSYTILEREEEKGIVSASDVRQALQWEAYPTYTQYDSIMRSFASSYPALCSLDTIGTSILGKLILAIKITSGINESLHKPRVFYTSSMHGNETGGFILMLRLSQYLLQNYGIDDYVTGLVDNLEIWINPLSNPDGTYRGGNEITNPTRGNANGYDLNRNFPDPEVSDNVSQKETKEMMEFLSRHRFNLSANFHSGSEVTNYPWDRWPRDHADAAWFYHICRSYADTAHVYSPKGYMTDLDNGVTDGYAWYSVYGGRQDYVTWSLSGREITVELDTNFVTPVSYLPVLWEANRRSLLGYIENAIYGIHGTVTDLITGKPVPASVTIEGHDTDHSGIYSDTTSGNFVRLINPGIWNLTFSAEGYIDTLVQNVAVYDREAIGLEVRMRPIKEPPVKTVTDIKLYPNPAGRYINAILPEKLRNMLDIRIFNSSGEEMEAFSIDASDQNPVEINISQLVAGTYFISIKNKSTGYSGSAIFSATGNN